MLDVGTSSGPATLGAGACPPTHTHTLFCVAKRKKGSKEKKRKSFKAETIKRLSPRSKYYCFSHSRESRIQKYFSLFHGSSTLKSISPTLHYHQIFHMQNFWTFAFPRHANDKLPSGGNKEVYIENMVILSQTIICFQNAATVSKSKVILKGSESINWKCVLSIMGKKIIPGWRIQALHDELFKIIQALHDEEFQ